MKLPATGELSDNDRQRARRRGRLKRLYLDACALVARADGVVAAAELATMTKGLMNIGLVDAGDDLMQLFDDAVDHVAELDLGLIESQWEKESLVSVLLAIAICDGDYDAREQAIVDAVAERIALPRARVDELRAIVEEALP